MLKSQTTTTAIKQNDLEAVNKSLQVQISKADGQKQDFIGKLRRQHQAFLTLSTQSEKIF